LTAFGFKKAGSVFCKCLLKNPVSYSPFLPYMKRYNYELEREREREREKKRDTVKSEEKFTHIVDENF
jgi:hypothetical protein